MNTQLQQLLAAIAQLQALNNPRQNLGNSLMVGSMIPGTEDLISGGQYIGGKIPDWLIKQRYGPETGGQSLKNFLELWKSILRNTPSDVSFLKGPGFKFPTPTHLTPLLVFPSIVNPNAAQFGLRKKLQT